ncbi:MAG: nucleotide sugar dehydrogenase [Alphaproteobacteria bacterium]|nr:nucleotide sugar dehydrogenase [Alphaproteobacteria bacterium]MBV9063306.1 nucleotide sugar dehydrogenase [Alphaproteobacteria bacterium]
MKFRTGNATVGVVGMGYVGQPLAITAHQKGFRVIGFDIDSARVAALNEGRSTIRTIPDALIGSMLRDRRFRASNNLREIANVDVVIICVPTPLNKYREPDLSHVRRTAEAVGAALRFDQLVCLESTTYPGCTSEIVRPAMEASGLKVGSDVFLAYSPEREDPGSKFRTSEIPKVVGADDPHSRILAEAFYGRLVDHVVPVANTATAEAVKLSENIFRCVNIALVNELKHIFARMEIDVWEVIDAAATKPFGYMPFYPGPGLGGHCVPIDPFYLSWKAREHEVPARFIELAGEINTAEPSQVVSALASTLSSRKQMSLNGSRILLVGVAYKRNVDDLRESPALTIFKQLEARGAAVDYYDPWVPRIPETRDFPQLAGRTSVPWNPMAFANDFDAALIVTDHSDVDYRALARSLDLIVDTRNAMNGIPAPRGIVVKA